MRRLLTQGSRLKCFGSTAFRYIESGPLLLGNKTNIRDGDAFKFVGSDLIGSFREGPRKQATVGELLYFLDVWGARAASRFIVGGERHCRRLSEWNPELTLSTVSFNSFALRRPVRRGDFLRVTGTVVSAGRSAVGVHLEAAEQGHDALSPVPAIECYVTLVCISAKELHKAVKDVVPGVRINSELGKKRHAAYMHIRELQGVKVGVEEAAAASSMLKPEALDDSANMQKPRKVSIADTVTSAVRWFFPSDLNSNKVVYGGVILHWMEEHARHCARMFAETSHMHTIGMYGMTFDSAVFAMDTAVLTAKVVYVRHSTLTVAVEINVERRDKSLTSHRAFFIVACIDDEFNKNLIAKGIDLQSSAPEHLVEYATAKKWYEYSLRYHLDPPYPELLSTAKGCTPAAY